MGREALVIGFARVLDEDGINISEIQTDPDGGDNLTADHYAPAGFDSAPIPGIDYAALSDAPGAGNVHGVGYLDPKNAGKSGPGEARIYARDSSGALMVDVWVKSDGSVAITNASGSLTMAANGDVTITGNLVVDGEVTAKAATPATSVTLSQHLHPTAMGPSSAPTPGT